MSLYYPQMAPYPEIIVVSFIFAIICILHQTIMSLQIKLKRMPKAYFDSLDVFGCYSALIIYYYRKTTALKLS